MPAKDGVIIEVYDLWPPDNGRSRFAIRYEEIDSIRAMTLEENREYFLAPAGNTTRFIPLQVKVAASENDYEQGKAKRPSYYSMCMDEKAKWPCCEWPGTRSGR